MCTYIRMCTSVTDKIILKKIIMFEHNNWYKSGGTINYCF